MKKLTVIFISLLIISGITFNSCKKDVQTTNQTSNKHIINNVSHKNRVREPLSNDEIINTIKAFQQSRSNFINNQSYSNYTQDEAIFQMSLVLNYELGLYGYYSDIENMDYEIEIANSGTNGNNETILNGGSMFTKYLELQELVNNQFADKKLCFLDIFLEETTQDVSRFKVNAKFGTRSLNLPASHILVDFPILPIDVPPVCNMGGYYDVVADAMTASWMPSNYSHFKQAGWVYTFEYTNYAQPYPYSYDNYGPGAFDFIFHSSSPVVIGGAGGTNPDGYNMRYYNYINNIRIALPSNAFADQVKIAHQYAPYSSSTGSWVNYQYTHRIQINIWSKSIIPGLFDSNLPIIM